MTTPARVINYSMDNMLMEGQRTRCNKGTPAEEAPTADAAEPPRSRRKPLPSDQSQRGEGAAREGSEVMKMRDM